MPVGVKVQFDAKDLVREDRFVGQGKVGWCQRNVVLWPSKGKGEIWSRKGGEGGSDNAEKGGPHNINFVQVAK